MRNISAFDVLIFIIIQQRLNIKNDKKRVKDQVKLK